MSLCCLSCLMVQVKEAVEHILCDSIQTYYNKLRTSYFMYTCEDPLLASANNEFMRLLQGGFPNWCSAHPIGGYAMSLSELVDTMLQSTIITCSTEGSSDVRHCKQAFWAAQDDPSMVWELGAVVFVEFLEAFARIVQRVFISSEEGSSARQLRIGYSLLVEMDHTNYRERRTDLAKK